MAHKIIPFNLGALELNISCKEVNNSETRQMSFYHVKDYRKSQGSEPKASVSKNMVKTTSKTKTVETNFLGKARTRRAQQFAAFKVITSVVSV